MLEPELRHLLLDALRPPPGYGFDAAIGTTYTLDLVAMLLPAVAFARYDVEADDGTPLANPIARLEAIRRHSRNITVFCHAGETRAPQIDLPALAFLEESVVPVSTPRAGGIFHPKVWAIRYVSPNAGRRYRFLCLSRNLTLDRSWDTILRLDGEQTNEPSELNAPLVAFLRALPGMAVTPLPRPRLAALNTLADEFKSVAWEGLHDGLRLEHFWPMGIDRTDTWPFPDNPRRVLVISPFASADALARLTRSRRDNAVVSLPETFDQLGQQNLTSVGTTLVLNPDAISESRPDADGVQESVSGATELSGLHAKLYVMDEPWWSRIWTGSANATAQAFSRNVEFLVELRGRTNRHGVGPLLDVGQPNEMRLARLFMEYAPSEQPLPEPEADKVQRSLERLAHEIGRLRFSANVRDLGEGIFGVDLVGSGHKITWNRDVEVRCRPATLGGGLATAPEVTATGLRARFETSFEGLTAFFVFQLRSGSAEAAVFKAFVLPAELVGAPQDRLERVMLTALKSRSDLMRLLFLLLGVIDSGSGDLEAVIPGGVPPKGSAAETLFGSESLLEPLMRAASRDPGRIDEIERLVSEVARADAARDVAERVVPPELPTLLAAIREGSRST